ncbi:hypothetical protein Smar_0678 [Staphylothermus marinus F1]|uniref:Uncharacterized protein n=1 Tax=Staphylothermus marinus (strain ATCC 43588 / DSM 3639 / JCM 9404 / F1) TaxID=399550 RepID=A3DMC3_STAMF|nr:hypothetical protein [Staphylothermus marinus]ABN69783.1 hypothetical protein Smar_0678 [Staphylothermus marinus F1]
MSKIIVFVLVIFLASLFSDIVASIDIISSNILNSQSITSTGIGFDAGRVVLSFLRSVIGINVENSSIVSIHSSTHTIPFSKLHRETDVRVVFVVNGSRYDAVVTMIDGRIRSYWLNGVFNESNLSLHDHLAIAYRFLKAFQKFTNNSYYGRFAEMVMKAMSEKKLLLTDNNFILNISHNPNNHVENTIIHFCLKMWGTKLPIATTLAVSSDGLVTRLFDTSMFYVATTKISISKDQAIQMALPYAEEYGREHGQKIVSINATLRFERDMGGVRGDCFAVYPVWQVWFTYDKIKNDIFAYSVTIWADTGEIYDKGPQGAYFPISEDTSNTNMLWSIIAFIMVASITIPATIMYRSKNRG